jgi:hypothetical protein
MKKAKVNKTNTALRQWARGISFTIAMGRRQVFTLVSMHLSSEFPHMRPEVGDRHRHMRHFVSVMHTLIDNGLAIAPIWEFANVGKGTDRLAKRLRTEPAKLTRGDCYRLTRAGELVVELLKEAGIYDEVRAELEAADQPRMRIA